jgi:Flp pilus assembly protein TadB
MTALVLLLACTTALALAACVRFWRQRNRLAAVSARCESRRVARAYERQEAAKAAARRDHRGCAEANRGTGRRVGGGR